MTLGLSPTPGSTVFIADSYGTEHLTVLLTAPDDAGIIAVVSITTDRQTVTTDKACFLEDGDHPFIRRRSYAFYADAQLLAFEALERGLASGAIRLGITCSPELTSRLINGAKVSPRTPRGVRDHVKRAHPKPKDCTD